MKKLFLLGIISCFIAGSLSAATITLTSQSSADLGAAPIDGYYYDADASVSLIVSDVTDNIDVSTQIFQPLTSDDGYRLPENSLLWKVYWNTGDIYPDYNSSDWRPYRLGFEKIITVRSDAVIDIGHGINRIPSVQPEGIYRTTIIYTLVEGI